MCGSEIRRPHLVGYEVRPEGFYETTKWGNENPKRLEESRTETGEASQPEQSATEEGMQRV